jgi:hypothetical protein
MVAHTARIGHFEDEAGVGAGAGAGADGGCQGGGGCCGGVSWNCVGAAGSRDVAPVG